MTLQQIGTKYGTDKAGDEHQFCDIYEKYFEALRNSRIQLVEIGVGGYHFSDRGGESLRMWNEYFPNAEIHGIDIFSKDFSIGERVKIYCAENPAAIIKNLAPDIIIDDGSHINADTIKNFKSYFPYLKSGGLYCVEDLQCSYWAENFFGSPIPGAEGTIMKFLTDLTHQLHYNTLEPQYKNEYAGQIEFVHFYKELCIVKKK